MSVDGKQGQVNTPQLVSKAEYARHCKYDRSYLSKKDVVARLKPAIVQKGSRILINVEMADAILKRERDTSKVRKKPQLDDGADEPGAEDFSAAPGSMDAERKINLRLKNAALELDLAVEKGQTLPREGVLAAAAQAGQHIREALASRNNSMAEQFSTMTDVRKILVAMNESDRTLLKTVSDDFMRKLQRISGGEEQPTEH